MKIFEFHFNPEKKNRVINTFSYESNKLKDKKNGYLYMAGELLNVLPGNEQLLNNLAKIIKEEYYSEFYPYFNDSIKKSLARANDYLSLQISKNNVSWLGNLNFGIVSIHGNKNISITQIGNVKILLIKNKKIVDITKNSTSISRNQEACFSPRVFNRLFSGKITEKDKIIILTKEVLDFFEKSLILEKITEEEIIYKDELEKIINFQKNEALKITGALLLIETSKEKEKRIEKEEEETELNFSFKKVFIPLINKIKKLSKTKFTKSKINKEKKEKEKEAIFPLKNFFISLTNKIKKTIKIKERHKKEIKKEINKNQDKVKKINFKSIKIDLSFLKSENSKKTIFLIIFLIVLLVVGSVIFKNNNRYSSNKIDFELIQIELKTAKDLISNNKKKEAFEILNNIYEKINLNDDFKDITKEVENYLIEMSEMELIEEPDLVYEFDARDLTPQRIFVKNEYLYFFSPFSNKIVELSTVTQESKEYFLPIERTKGPSSVRNISNNLIFFVKPNQLFSLRDQELKTLGSLKEPENNYNFNYFSVFWTSLYFWDSENKEIIRYTSYDSNPEKWLVDSEKKSTDIKSMSVDGSIWIIEKDNTISRYSSGTLAQEISLKIFPKIENPSHIFTSPLFYRIFILEPLKNRIIITDKQGNIIKQLKSDKFNNLVHFSISENGKEIYLLNNLQVYKINF